MTRLEVEMSRFEEALQMAAGAFLAAQKRRIYELESKSYHYDVVWNNDHVEEWNQYYHRSAYLKDAEAGDYHRVQCAQRAAIYCCLRDEGVDAALLMKLSMNLT
jgi:hypothetical protein